jgi:hypothetical protein
MVSKDYSRTTTVTRRVEATPEPMPAPTQLPATPESLWDLRQKYRSGLIVLGDFFSVLDRFLDGLKQPEVTPAKEPSNG